MLHQGRVTLYRDRLCDTLLRGENAIKVKKPFVKVEDATHQGRKCFIKEEKCYIKVENVITVENATSKQKNNTSRQNLPSRYSYALSR